jgi:hypothetical protein
MSNARRHEETAVSAGKAHGENREYQVACRDVLMFRDPELEPWKADGIDIPFKLADSEWTFDVALRSVSGGVVVAECRRTKGPVKQEDVAAFAYKVEALRRALNLAVAGAFITKSDHQLGAVRVGQFNGITVAVLREGSTPPGFNIVFLRYDLEREAKLRDYVMHVPSGSIAITGQPATLSLGNATIQGMSPPADAA